MAWSPTPEVAVVRDACEKMGGHTAILVTIMDNGTFTTASYGRTRALCAKAKKMGDALHNATMLCHTIGPEPTKREIERLLKASEEEG